MSERHWKLRLHATRLLFRLPAPSAYDSHPGERQMAETMKQAQEALSVAPPKRKKKKSSSGSS